MVKKKGSKIRNKPEESFFDRVYKVVRKVPMGRVTSYGAIARYLGSTGSARMVGWALNSSHSSHYPVPAQRVVNRNGLLTGKHHFGSPNLMQQLLESEGIIIENNQVKNFEKIFWDPMKELAAGSSGKQSLKRKKAGQ